ncbi:hypothetical protein F4781DRAFT_429529 [Annulohypoxylon bovei var. microspora]|nr:hypothetical protein F4781DRAFT_429529 [Annulohypoxylon bovei var. microspora]
MREDASALGHWIVGSPMRTAQSCLGRRRPRPFDVAIVARSALPLPFPEEFRRKLSRLILLRILAVPYYTWYFLKLIIEFFYAFQPLSFHLRFSTEDSRSSWITASTIVSRPSIQRSLNG